MRVRTFLLSLLAVSSATAGLPAQSGIAVWGINYSGQTTAPPLPPGLTYVQIDAGGEYAVALRSDGSVVAWGANTHGCCDVPQIPVGLRYVHVEAGVEHTVALRSDGSVVAWGGNGMGQCNVPHLPPGMIFVQIAAGAWHTVALRSDGYVVAWGDNILGECNVPAFPPGVTCLEVAARGNEFGPGGQSLARLNDGSIVSWGDTTRAPSPPPGLSFVKIDAGEGGCVALRSDGSIVVWYAVMPSMRNVPPLPPGLRYTDVAAGYTHVLAVRSDGAVVAWGNGAAGQCDVPDLPPGLRYVEVSAGNCLSLARYEGCPTCELPFCVGDGGRSSVECPCANIGRPGRGCENSASTGGAQLTVRGSIHPDRVVLSVIGTAGSAPSLFVQGSSVLEVAHVFGDGARCVGGNLKRLGLRTSDYPAAGDPPISTRSARLGDPIPLGSFRYYQVLYRDATPSFCTGATFNASNAVMVAW